MKYFQFPPSQINSWPFRVRPILTRRYYFMLLFFSLHFFACNVPQFTHKRSISLKCSPFFDAFCSQAVLIFNQFITFSICSLILTQLLLLLREYVSSLAYAHLFTLWMTPMAKAYGTEKFRNIRNIIRWENFGRFLFIPLFVHLFSISELSVYVCLYMCISFRVVDFH